MQTQETGKINERISEEYFLKLQKKKVAEKERVIFCLTIISTAEQVFFDFEF